jgi:hypothetical protein
LAASPHGADPGAHEAIQRPAGSRSSGALVAASISAAVALVGLAFEVPFLAIGIPAATVAGWLLGPSVRAGAGNIGAAVAMGVTTVALADAFVVLGSAAASLFVNDASGGNAILDAIAGSMIIWIIGFVIVGLPMLLITAPCGLVWAAVVRSLAASRTPQ